MHSPKMDDVEEDSAKEVFARFGLAVYQCQCLEHGLANLIMTTQLVRVRPKTRESWEGLIDCVLDDAFTKTFGNLLKALHGVVTVDDRTKQTLLRAKDIRDELAHRFFRERAEDFMTSVGKQRMLDHLSTLSATLEEAILVVDMIEGAVAKHLGIQPQDREEAYVRYESEIRARDGGDLKD